MVYMDPILHELIIKNWHIEGCRDMIYLFLLLNEADNRSNYNYQVELACGVW